MNRSAELFERAKRFLAGGVSRNTLMRTPHPLYVETAKGCRITDVDGVERIDFANNMAALIHGHAHPAIVKAVTAQLPRGTGYTMTSEVEVDFAQHMCERALGFDKIRFVNSGTEAVMTAVKAARAFTGRPRIAKVEGTYHGGYDYAEVSQAPAPERWGDPRHPFSVALADGTPEGVLRDVIVIPFNHPRDAQAILDQHRGEIACVLVDPIPHRVGLVPAKPEFVEALYEWTTGDGALLLFDEVISFRSEVGGMQARYSATPDLTAMAKIIGGGFPVGALAGREEVMAVFGEQGRAPRLPQSGTFSANPVTMTAGLTAMRLFDEDAVARLNQLGERARGGIAEAIAVAGVPASVTGTGSAFRIHMKAAAPTDYRSAFPDPGEVRALKNFIDLMLDEGILITGTGSGFLSTPMGEAEVDRLVEAVLASLRRCWPETCA